MLLCFGGVTRTATGCLSERSDSALTGPKQKNTPLTQDAFLFWRRHPESDRGIKVLQTSALPLGYGAEKMERITGLEPATSTLARWRSTK